MNLNGKTLEEWFLEQAMNKMPYSGKRDYASAYKNLTDYLNNHVHPKVNISTLIGEAKDGEYFGYLTDHGPDHIKTVIKRVSDLLQADRLVLSQYETYLLLLAIHFHDVGHVINGREDHEINSKKILEEVGKFIGGDTAEQRLIWKIAQAHGGSPKNKITQLQVKENILGYSVRTQLLSALLKFGDELADDRTRAERYLLEKNKIPDQSKVFHEYANALYSVDVDIEGKEIRLTFELLESKAIEEFTKGNNKIFLVDEIINRVKKMHMERMYCMRFFAPYFQIDSISVKIEFYTDDGFDAIKDPLGFRFREEGYPDISHMSLDEICPELKDEETSVVISGKIIKLEIEKKLNKTNG